MKVKFKENEINLKKLAKNIFEYELGLYSTGRNKLVKLLGYKPVLDPTPNDRMFRSSYRFVERLGESCILLYLCPPLSVLALIEGLSTEIIDLINGSVVNKDNYS